MTRCKVGDLAVVVSASPTKLHRIGCVVLVVEPYNGPFAADWIVEYKGAQYRSRDRNLRPIRNPGEHETDETLLRVPSPIWQRAWEEA